MLALDWREFNTQVAAGLAVLVIAGVAGLLLRTIWPRRVAVESNDHGSDTVAVPRTVPPVHVLPSDADQLSPLADRLLQVFANGGRTQLESPGLAASLGTNDIQLQISVDELVQRGLVTVRRASWATNQPAKVILTRRGADILSQRGWI